MIDNSPLPDWAAEVSQLNKHRKKFSIGTLVTDVAEYQMMRATFVRAGFLDTDCEYICVDNRNPPQTRAYAGLNTLLSRSSGVYVILCHQDVRIEFDDRAKLEKLLVDLEQNCPMWGVAGNAGATKYFERAICIVDPTALGTQIKQPFYSKQYPYANFPYPVSSLDENFLLLRREADLRFSSDIAFQDDSSSFHLYGTDICLQAEVRGYSAHVIDFLLRHNSGGNLSRLDDATDAFRAKWGRIFPKRSMLTTCTHFEL